MVILFPIFLSYFSNIHIFFFSCMLFCFYFGKWMKRRPKRPLMSTSTCMKYDNKFSFWPIKSVNWMFPGSVNSLFLLLFLSFRFTLSRPRAKVFLIKLTYIYVYECQCAKSVNCFFFFHNFYNQWKWDKRK